MAFWLPLIATVASVAAGAAKIGQGYQQKKALNAQAREKEAETQMARIRGAQIGEESRDALHTALQNIDAIRSARGMSLNSQTAQAIEKRTIDQALRDEAILRLSEFNRAGSAANAAVGYRSAAKWAVPLAVLGAAPNFASAASYGSTIKR